MSEALPEVVMLVPHPSGMRRSYQQQRLLWGRVLRGFLCRGHRDGIVPLLCVVTLSSMPVSCWLCA